MVRAVLHVLLGLGLLVGGLVLQATGVRAGTWMALGGVLVLLAVVHPLPEQEELRLVAALVAVAVPVLLVLDALDAPDWTGLAVVVAGTAAFVALARRQDLRRTGRVHVPPVH